MSTIIFFNSYVYSFKNLTFTRIVDGAGNEIGYGVACDSSGNMYLAGSYQSTPTIKDQAGTSLGTLPASSGSNVAFVCKFDSSGNYNP